MRKGAGFTGKFSIGGSWGNLRWQWQRKDGWGFLAELELVVDLRNNRASPVPGRNNPPKGKRRCGNQGWCQRK